MTHRTWKNPSNYSFIMQDAHRMRYEKESRTSMPSPCGIKSTSPFQPIHAFPPTKKIHRTSVVRVFTGVLLGTHTWLSRWPRDQTQSPAPSTPCMSQVVHWLKVLTLSIHVIGLSGDYVSSSLELYARNLKQRADKYFFTPWGHLATICLPYLSFCLILFSTWVLQSQSQMPYFLPLNCYQDCFSLNVTLPSLTTNSNHCYKFSLSCKLRVNANCLFI